MVAVVSIVDFPNPQRVVHDTGWPPSFLDLPTA